MKPRILVIDDNDDIRTVICGLLEEYGFEAMGASNGKEGFDLLEQGAFVPDAIVLDLRMPVMDGEAFRQKQLQDTRFARIPAILHSTVGNSELAHRLQCQAIVDKGSPRDLLREIDRILGTDKEGI